MKNKKIIIIGGTGALGRMLIKKYYMENTILVFSRDEHKHVYLRKIYPNISYQIGDVKDKDSIAQAIVEFKPDVVINTAALKHVTICEDNPFESVKTNILGHRNLIDCIQSSTHKIKTLIFISTDKACKPINVYGMCKAISERLYIDFANKQNKIKVVTCRYGNVLESTGSVIPYFKELLESGEKSLPITDKRMTRFTLSLQDSVELIDWAYKHKHSHGNIVVPKLKSMLITDLALIIGKKYGIKDVSLEIIGIKPGEKLHEEMVSLEESMRAISFEKYYMITDNVISDKSFSLSSENSLMTKNEIKELLLYNNTI